MRIPHTVNKNTKIEYDPSTLTVELQCEVNRRIETEDFDWDDELCPSLATLCVQAICKRFEDNPIIDKLNCTDRNYLVEILSTDLPLELVVPLIEAEIYWERRYTDKFGPIKTDIPSDCNWKCVFLSRFIQEKVEEAQPQYVDEENMDELLDLLQPYIRRLKATQLQPWKPPLTMEKEDIPDVYPLTHINFQPILRKLTNLEELEVMFCVNKVGEDFNWNMFKLSVNDIKNIGLGVLKLENITVLRLHKSKVEDEHVQVLMQQLIKNKTIKELDLSNCHVKDRGALCIAKVLMVHPTLERLNLSHNRITGIGGEGFGFALLVETCPLLYLNLRLNPLGHDGVMGVFRALVRGTKLQELVIAATEFVDETALRCGQMIKLNSSLTDLDVSSNWFGEEGGQSVLAAMEVNTVIRWIDFRETDIPKAMLTKINKALQRNRVRDEEDEEEGEEEEEETEEEIEGEVEDLTSAAGAEEESKKDEDDTMTIHTEISEGG